MLNKQCGDYGMAIIFGKKAALNFIDNWVEYVSLLFLILGAIMTFIAGSKVLSVLVVFLSSMIIGRLVYVRKYKHQGRFWIMAIAFVIGMAIGSRFLSYKVVLVTFVIGAYAGYWIKKHHVLD